MDFSSFANLLYGVLGQGASKGAFTRELLLAITDYDDAEENPVLALVESTFRSYFNRHNGVGHLAAKISGHLEPEAFAAYLEDSLTDAAAAYLCEALTPVCGPLTAFELPEQCAALFQTILVTAAQKCRASAKTPARQANALSPEYLAEAIRQCRALTAMLVDLQQAQAKQPA